MSTLPPAILLMGPTASGKTGVALELAQHLPVEIISVDSALVYRDMDIGTAKPDAAMLAQATHHLIDIIDPTEAYSAAAFRRDALRLMGEITARGNLPLLVGGTMLYFKALREGLSALPPSDPAIRSGLNDEIARHGIEAMHRQLAEVDAVTAARLHPTDTQRIQRALEIYRISGKPMSAQLTHREDEPLPCRLVPIALIPSDRAVLHARIATRFDAMLEDGLVEELRGLRQKYALTPDMTSMRCVGYRQAWQFLEGEIDQAALRETGIAATRQLAKRQLTWLRSMEDCIEVDCLAPELARIVFCEIERFVLN